VLSVSLGENVEAARAMRACVNGCVGEHERHARSDEGADIGEKIGRNLDAVREVFKIWRAPAAACNGNPIAPAARIRRQRGM
jgi:hypothetical protein